MKIPICLSQHHNQGFGTEATNAITRYAFKQLGAKRLTITCDIDNIRSKKIAERLHYNLEGVLKCHRRKPINNELSDTLVYAKYDLENLPSLYVEWGTK
jgi:ribosomal-protein-serine acetyltransferase